MVTELQAIGHTVEVIHPGQFKTFPCRPTPRSGVGVYEPVQELFKAFEPEAVHIATEGPSAAARRICVEWKLPFTATTPASRNMSRRACLCRWPPATPT